MKPKLKSIPYHDRLLSDEQKRKEEIYQLAVRMWRTIWYVGSTYVVAAGTATLFDSINHWQAFLGLGLANLFWLASERD